MSFLNFFGKNKKPQPELGPVEKIVPIIDPSVNENLAEINERLRRIEIKQKETGLQLEEIDGFLQGDVAADAAETEKALVEALIALADTIGDFYYFADQGNRDADDPPDGAGVAWYPPNETERGFVLVDPEGVEGDAEGEEDENDDENDDGREDADIEDADSSLFEQARMMWNAAKNAAETAGLDIIEAEREPFDFSVHSAESVERDEGLPNGYVIKTLKCGYVYKDEVVRRAAVVVNKTGAPNVACQQEEIVDESWN